MKSVRIKRDDTLSKLAERHRCTVEQLMRVNGIPNKGVRLEVNMRMLIPEFNDLLPDPKSN